MLDPVLTTLAKRKLFLVRANENLSPVEVSISDANIITVYQAQQGRKYCSIQIQKYESEI